MKKLHTSIDSNLMVRIDATVNALAQSLQSRNLISDHRIRKAVADAPNVMVDVLRGDVELLSNAIFTEKNAKLQRRVLVSKVSNLLSVDTSNLAVA